MTTTVIVAGLFVLSLLVGVGVAFDRSIRTYISARRFSRNVLYDYSDREKDDSEEESTGC